MTKLMAPAAPPQGTATFPRLSEYLGQVVVLGPTEEVEVDTQYGGGKPAVRCIGWAWVNGKLVDLGTVLVFWGKVRAQLRPAIESGSYVVARIVKSGKAYILDPVTDEVTLKAIEQALDF